MCGRFTLLSNIEDLSARFGFTSDRTQILPNYNIAPEQQVLAVTDHEGNTRAEFMRWGLKPHWNTNHSKNPNFINARIETVSTKPSFKSAFRYRRCLIIANGFYEWDRNHNKSTPYYFQLEHGQPFAFAGIWNTWSDPQTNKMKSCAILTREAASPVISVHNRMPAIVPPENEARWTNAQLNEASDIKRLLLDPARKIMGSWRVSTLVNYSKNNDPRCIVRT